MKGEIVMRGGGGGVRGLERNHNIDVTPSLHAAFQPSSSSEPPIPEPDKRHKTPDPVPGKKKDSPPVHR